MVDVSGLLKPVRSERSFAATADSRGKFTGRFLGREFAVVADNGGTMKTDTALNIEDDSQFPALTVKQQKFVIFY